MVVFGFFTRRLFGQLPWPPSPGQLQNSSDLESPESLEYAVFFNLAHLALGPEILVLGTGARHVFPPPATHTHVLSRGVGFEVMDTAAACRTYNVLVQERRRVVAALILP